MDEFCEWTTERSCIQAMTLSNTTSEKITGSTAAYDTNCGHYYNPYIGVEKPVITKNEFGDDICPWCGRKIEYMDLSEEDWENDE